MIRAALLCLMLAAPGLAQDVVVPFERNYPPFSGTSSEGVHDGFNIAVARALAERAGIEIRLEPVSFFEISDGGWPGEWGYAVASLSYLASRAEHYDYIGQYLYDQVVVVGREPEDGAGMRAVDGSRIGVCRSCAYRQYLEGEFVVNGDDGTPPFRDITIDATFTSETAMIEDLVSGAPPAFDFVVVSRFFAEFQFISAGFPIRIASDPLYSDPLFIVASKEHPDLKEPLTEALASLEADGTLAALSTQFLGDDFTRNHP